MRVVITGGCGFIGQMVARSVLRRGKLLTHAPGGTAERLAPVTEVVLADVSRPPRLLFDQLEEETQVVLGDVSDAGFCRSLMSTDDTPLSIFHLGAVMSGQGEADFDLAMGVNLHGTLNLLEAARHAGGARPRFILASAGATLGAGSPTDFVSAEGVVGDETRATPHTTYGMTKACAELLVGDYSRRGFVDGRGVRLPTVLVRAGAPNAATTGCFSAVIREPLAGDGVIAPISPHVKHAVTSYRTAVDCLVGMHELEAETVDSVLGYDRTVFVPSTALSLSDLDDALRKVVSPSSAERLGKVSYAADEKLSAAVGSFPTKVDCRRALQLGLGGAIPPDAETMVREYCEDFPEAICEGIVLAPRPSAEESSTRRRSVALVTGGGTGIGKAVAMRLAQGGWQEEGATVSIVLTGRRREVLEEAAAEIEAAHGDAVETLVVPADLTVEAEVGALFSTLKAQFGRLDVLFNNAGAGIPPTSVELMSMADWRKVVGINLDAAFHVARDAFVLMKEQTPQGGRIINNGSISATTPRPGSIAYTASKHAVSGLTKSLSLDGRPFSIAAGQIDYGNVVSAISAGMAVGMPQPDGSVRPEPRMSQTDAANAVHYMASLPLTANVLQMTVMATNMPFVGRG